MAWTEARAALWRARAPRDYEPIPWLIAGGVVVGIAFVTAPDFWDVVPCGEPGSSCGPTPVLAFILPLLIVTGGLLLFLPWGAVLSSGVAAVVALWFWVPLAPGVITWPVFPIVLGSWLWHGRRLIRAQRRFASPALVSLPPGVIASVRRVRPQRSPWEMPEVVLLCLVMAGALGAPALYLAYGAEIGRDDQSRLRALELDGTIIARHGVSEDSEQTYAITVRVDEAVEGLGRELVIEPWGTEHRLGQSVTILVDPERPAWTRLASEPPDHFWLLAFGHLAALVGVGALAVLIDQRQRAHQLRKPMVTDRGLPVRIGPGASRGSVPILCSDTAWSFAGFHPDAEDPFGRAQISRDTRAYLVGGLSKNDPAQLALETGQASYPGRLRFTERGWVNLRAKRALEMGVDGPTPVPYLAPDEFRWQQRRWGGVAARILGVLAPVLPFATFPWVSNTWIRAGIAVLAVAVAVCAIRVEGREVVLDARRFTTRGMWGRTRIPTWAVAEVSLTHDLRVVLLDNQGESIELDLGERGWEFADRVAGFIEARTTSPDPSMPRTSFAETAQVWRRPTLALLPLVVICVAAAWLLLG